MLVKKQVHLILCLTRLPMIWNLNQSVQLSQMVAYLEPAMIVVMAVIVGFIMISVIVPIYQSYQSIGAQ